MMMNLYVVMMTVNVNMKNYDDDDDDDDDVVAAAADDDDDDDDQLIITMAIVMAIGTAEAQRLFTLLCARNALVHHSVLGLLQGEAVPPDAKHQVVHVLYVQASVHRRWYSIAAVDYLFSASAAEIKYSKISSPAAAIPDPRWR